MKQYWHQIVEINQDDIPKGLKVGHCMGMDTKHNGRVPLLDFENKRETWQYRLRYLGVLDKELPCKVKIERIKKMKGYDALNVEGVKK